MFRKKKSNNNNNDKINSNSEDVELTTHKKRYISLEERQQTIDELMLIFTYLLKKGIKLFIN